ncbi:MAG TPA: relaxase/mobilization nuclease domain-containing protein [Steroidobacteraceae bacterium]|nr:relaxase/mobilization nuclease domain-containing protein [Steroidobacteraceae bacterium]
MSRVSVSGEPPLFDLRSYGRYGERTRDHLSPAEIAQIARTVHRVPEVMVKVSGGGKTPGAVAAHFQYIDRHGELEIETDEGERLVGNGVEKKLLADWDLEGAAAERWSPYTGRPGRKPGKLVHNIVLSMPAGTPPEKLQAASQAFAREQFALKHRYALVLHTDQEHPHVHLVVKAVDEKGDRLNIRKATLRSWRQEFANQLRAQGVAANATPRQVRGETKSWKQDGIVRAARRGQSTHLRRRVEAVARWMAAGTLPKEPASSRLLETRNAVIRGWRDVAARLHESGQPALAGEVVRFVARMPLPRTENQQIAARLQERFRDRNCERLPPTR